MMNKNLIPGFAAAAVALIAVSGFAFYASAGENAFDNGNRQFRGQMWENLSEDAKAEIEAIREQRREDMEARRQEREKAIAEGYDAFKSLVGEDSPIFNELEESEFPSFQEAHRLMSEAREKFESIGLERGFGGPGMRGAGKMGGFHKGPGDCQGFGQAQMQ